MAELKCQALLEEMELEGDHAPKFSDVEKFKERKKAKQAKKRQKRKEKQQQEKQEKKQQQQQSEVGDSVQGKPNCTRPRGSSPLARPCTSSSMRDKKVSVPKMALPPKTPLHRKSGGMMNTRTPVHQMHHHMTPELGQICWQRGVDLAWLANENVENDSAGVADNEPIFDTPAQGIGGARTNRSTALSTPLYICL